MADEFGNKMFKVIDETARDLFVTDPEVSQDRTKYGTFDRMPPELKEWWRERALRKINENA